QRCYFWKLQCRRVVLMRALELRIYILCGRASRTRDVLRLAPDDVLPGALLSAFQTRYQAVVAAGESSGRRSANTSYRLGSWTTGQKREGRVPMTRPQQKPLPRRRSVDAHRFQIVLAHGGESKIAAGQHGDFGAVRGMDGEAGLIIDDDAPDIGHVLHAEEREFLGRDLPQLLVDLIHGPFLSPAVPRVASSAATAWPLSLWLIRQRPRAGYLSAACSMVRRAGFAAVLISTLRTLPSTT